MCLLQVIENSKNAYKICLISIMFWDCINGENILIQMHEINT